MRLPVEAEDEIRNLHGLNIQAVDGGDVSESREFSVPVHVPGEFRQLRDTVPVAIEYQLAVLCGRLHVAKVPLKQATDLEVPELCPAARRQVWARLRVLLQIGEGELDVVSGVHVS